MTIYLDSTILVAALVEDEPAHEACLRLMRGKSLYTWTHALAEVFATLTGGRLGIRVSPAVAFELIDTSLRPRLSMIELNASAMLKAMRDAEDVGVRGGAVFDYLHLIAARQSSAKTIYTLNTRHFSAIFRRGDPKIERPE